MRIALVCSSFLPVVGGTEWKVHYLASEYVDRGHDVTVFAARPPAHVGHEPMPVEPAYEIRRCDVVFPGMRRFGVSTWLFRQAIIRSNRRRKIDVLHCHHLGTPTHCGLTVKRRTGIPVVATSCGGDVMTLPEIGYGDRLTPHHDRLFRRNMLEVDVVGSVCDAIHDELRRLETPARIVDIPNGVAWESFQLPDDRAVLESFGIPRNAQVILSAGRNHPVKAYGLGIRAFARLADEFPQAVYLLVGRKMADHRSLAEELGIADRVRFVEQQTHDAMPRIFRAADLFFSPSLMEGFSQVNAQAMAAALPLVLSDAPGNRDSGKFGGALFAEPGNVESMAQSIRHLLADSQLRRRLGTEAHEISKRFAWKEIAKTYLEVFDDCLRMRAETARPSKT